MYVEVIPPAEVDGSEGRATAVACGANHTCAIQFPNRAVVCWGPASFSVGHTCGNHCTTTFRVLTGKRRRRRAAPLLSRRESMLLLRSSLCPSPSQALSVLQSCSLSLPSGGEQTGGVPRGVLIGRAVTR